MGLGHVPPGPLRQAGAGLHRPGRERRGARPAVGFLDRAAVGRLGEDLAVDFLRRRGVRVVARNVEAGRGEIDIVAVLGGERTAVEVRTITGDGPPTAAFDAAKADRVWRSARLAGCVRVALVAVRLGREGVVVHWIPRV